METVHPLPQTNRPFGQQIRPFSRTERAAGARAAADREILGLFWQNRMDPADRWHERGRWSLSVATTTTPCSRCAREQGFSGPIVALIAPRQTT